MTRAAILMACLFALSGCGGMMLTFAGANLVSVIHSDKTLPDFAISGETGKNCTLLHAARNEPYCQSPLPDQTEVLADLAANRYCYRTLGGIDCYDRPDYVASGLTRIEFAAGYLDQPGGRAPNVAKDVPAPMAQADPPTPAPNPAPAKPPVKVLAKAPPRARAAAPPPVPSPSATPGVPTPDRVSATLAQVPPRAKVPPLGLEPGQGTY